MTTGKGEGGGGVIGGPASHTMEERRGRCPTSVRRGSKLMSNMKMEQIGARRRMKKEMEMDIGIEIGIEDRNENRNENRSRRRSRII